MITVEPYELRARFAPTFVVVLPWVLVIVGLVYTFRSTILTTTAAAAVVLVLLYALSFVVRHLGHRIENRLWARWGGPPSAVVLSPGHTLFSEDTKSAIRSCLVNGLGIAAADHPSWVNNVDHVQEAFRRVRQYVRQHDPKGLWAAHNAEYGFLRNLLGSWWLLLTNCLLAAASTLALWYLRGGNLILALAAIEVALGLAAVAGRLLVLPAVVREAAFRYVESAWMSFLTNAQGANRRKDGGGAA